MWIALGYSKSMKTQRDYRIECDYRLNGKARRIRITVRASDEKRAVNAVQDYLRRKDAGEVVEFDC